MARGSSNTDVEEALRLFFASPPAGTPPEVIDALSGAVNSRGGVLPPRLFMEAVEQMPVAVSITDIDAQILYANRACSELTGYSPGELVGENESILSDKGTPREVYDDLWKTIGKGRAWTGMLVNRRKDGTKYLADLIIVPVRGHDGKVGYYLGMHRDVTELHNLQKQVLNQKALIESVVDVAPVAVALVDVKRKVILDNLAYKSLMADMGRIEPAEAVLHHWLDGIGRTWAEARRAKLEFRHLEIRLDLRGGRGARWYSCSGTWAHELVLGPESYFENLERQQGLLIVCNDITEQRRQYEIARANAVKAMMTDYQMQSGMREAVLGAIFQLQGPVNVMAAAADLLARRGGEARSEAAVIDQALDAGRQALDRLRSCLPDIAIEPVQAVNINEAVRDVLEVSTERALRDGIVVDWSPVPVLPMVPGKPYAIRAMIKHLLDNAMDAVAEPGATAREILVETALSHGGEVVVRLHDGGPGFDPALRHSAFEPFFSGWKSHRGRSGMGLTVAQQVITEQGGNIEIEQGRGAGGSGGCCVRVLFASPSSRRDMEGDAS